jgi:predicted glycogen debranching enzyme
MTDEVQQLLTVFAHFEDRGTLPNTIRGEDASNRDTSDAPLWFGIVCEELAETMTRPRAAAFYATQVDHRGRTVADVLRSIACGYRDGTPNGIRMDPESALVWSPSHFTWMDTNYPAGTPREGYPVEIQALWVRLLRQVARLAGREGEEWSALAQRAEQSLLEKFWLEEKGWISDLLLAAPFVPARDAVADTALRSNGLFAVSLGLLTGERARRTVDAALRHLVVPGALRSLAPLPVSPPLPIRGRHSSHLLNDPENPYQGRYEGDEDTRRKPAYHNGTAWTWTFPVFCEALARAWDFNESAVTAASVYLGSMDALLHEGCLGQIPEILDGDAPHTQRGCDAQAWGVTEAVRVWKLLHSER